MALAAHGLHGLQGSVASAMHSATVFFAAQGLHGLQPARATLVPPIATSDIVTASAIGLRLDRFEAFLVIKELLIIQYSNKVDKVDKRELRFYSNWTTTGLLSGI